MPEKNFKDKKIRTIFMGTPEFSLAGLQALIDSPRFELVGVFTQTDKPVGRHQILTPPPVKVLAREHNLPVFQPLKMKDGIEPIRELKPDLIVVIAYGKIIPDSILAIPPLGCINVHASLLPKYRGAACLNAPILNGDAETGVTIMKIDSGLDTGPILRQSRVKLSGRETLEDVHDNLSKLGAELLLPTLEDFIAGKIEPQIQDDTQASYVKTLKKEDGKIDCTKPAKEIERMIRAYNPWPGTFGLIGPDGKMLKICAAAPEVFQGASHKTGELFLNDKNLYLQCGQDSLHILKLQLAGTKAMTAEEFTRGHASLIGQIMK